MKTENFEIIVDNVAYTCKHEYLKDHQSRENQNNFDKNLAEAIRNYEKEQPTGKGMIPYNNFECGIYYEKKDQDFDEFLMNPLNSH